MWRFGDGRIGRVVFRWQNLVEFAGVFGGGQNILYGVEGCATSAVCCVYGGFPEEYCPRLTDEQGSPNHVDVTPVLLHRLANSKGTWRLSRRASSCLAVGRAEIETKVGGHRTVSAQLLIEWPLYRLGIGHQLVLLKTANYLSSLVSLE